MVSQKRTALRNMDNEPGPIKASIPAAIGFSQLKWGQPRVATPPTSLQKPQIHQSQHTRHADSFSPITDVHQAGRLTSTMTEIPLSWRKDSTPTDVDDPRRNDEAASTLSIINEVDEPPTSSPQASVAADALQQPSLVDAAEANVQRLSPDIAAPSQATSRIVTPVASQRRLMTTARQAALTDRKKASSNPSGQIVRPDKRPNALVDVDTEAVPASQSDRKRVRTNLLAPGGIRNKNPLATSGVAVSDASPKGTPSKPLPLTQKPPTAGLIDPTVRKQLKANAGPPLKARDANVVKTASALTNHTKAPVLAAALSKENDPPLTPAAPHRDYTAHTTSMAASPPARTVDNGSPGDAGVIAQIVSRIIFVTS